MTSEEEKVKVTEHSIKEMLEAVQADRDARKAFLAMPREEQLLAILSMIAYTNSQLAIIQKEQFDQRNDMKEFKREARDARLERRSLERQLAEKLDIRIEKPEDDTLTTTEKVKAIIVKSLGLGWWLDIVKSVLTTIITVVTLAILYFVFGGRMPVP